METTTNQPSTETTKRVTKADLLRAVLKTAGYKSTQVSVKQSPCTYSTSLRVTIRTAAIKHSEIKALAERFESVRRDEYSGEILLGGNTYLEVAYSEEALDSLTDEIEPTIMGLQPDGHAVEVRGLNIVWCAGSDCITVLAHDDERDERIHAYGKADRCTARRIAAMIANGGKAVR